MKLLLDEMWTPVVAEQLRRRGHDVEAVLEREDLVMQSDTLIFATAPQEQRVVVTENSEDFAGLALDRYEAGQEHIGLIYTVDSRFPRRGCQGIGPLVTALDALLTANPDLTNREHWLS